MEEIGERAGVSRGPLYHWFKDKRDLFRAVYEQIEGELAGQIFAQIQKRAAEAPDMWEQVRIGSQTYLDVCLDPAIQRIALIEAPVVLGAGTGGHLARYGLALIRDGVQRSMEQGMIARQPVEPLAHLIRAALTEGAIYIARAEDQAKARTEVGEAVDRLLAGLRVGGQ
jgi:AcrR family transcriptional regulator